MRLKWCSISETSLQLLIFVTGFSVFHHRLGHPRYQIKNLEFDLRNQMEEKRHTQTQSRASAKDVRGSDLSASAQGVGTSFRGHTHIRWQLPQMTLHSEAGEIGSGQTKMIWNKEWSTQHTHHRILKIWVLLILLFKMQSNRAPWPKRNVLVKHCYS